MFNAETLPDSVTLTSQNVLTRVVAQERENVLLQADLKLSEEAAQLANVEEKAAYAEAEASLQEVVRLCLLCAATVRDDKTMDALTLQLTQCVQEEEAAAQSFALEARHERAALLAYRSRVVSEGGGGRQEELEHILKEEEEEAQRERAEILRLEQERIELERRTELATLRYARELFNVHVE